MWALIHRWHRKLGITSALFVILLVITGLMLNHTGKLDLQNIFIKNDLILKWYDIQPKGEVQGFAVGSQNETHWLSQIDNRLYFDQMELVDHANNVVGVVSANDGFIIALADGLMILTTEGKLIEKLSALEGVPAEIQAIGLSESGDVMVKTAQAAYLADIESEQWTENTAVAVSWSESRQIPESLYEQLLTLYRGKGLPMERVILDLHSGRILGQAGVWLVDMMAILFLLLALSGVWMWYKYR